MILTLVLAFVPPVIVPPVIVPPLAKPLDYHRIVGCIMTMEATPWKHAGGALGFKESAWRESSKLPYSCAKSAEIAIPTAERRLAAFSERLSRLGIESTVENLGLCWRFGFKGAVAIVRGHSDSEDLRGARGDRDYGRRCENLYEDQTFTP